MSIVLLFSFSFSSFQGRSFFTVIVCVQRLLCWIPANHPPSEMGVLGPDTPNTPYISYVTCVDIAEEAKNLFLFFPRHVVLLIDRRGGKKGRQQQKQQQQQRQQRQQHLLFFLSVAIWRSNEKKRFDPKRRSTLRASEKGSDTFLYRFPLREEGKRKVGESC